MEHTPISPAGAPLDASALFLPSDIGMEPLSAVARALRGFNRGQLGSTIEVLIALLDVADGDPDAEADDRGGETVAIVDDPDLPPEDGESDPDLEEGDLEDSFVLSPSARRSGTGAGCQISDPGGAGEGEDDEHDGTDRGDISWAEWHTLPAASRRSGRIDGLSADSWVRTIHEDDEEDDPAEDNDAPEEDDHPGVPANEEEPAGYMQVRMDEGAGCPMSDGDRDDPADRARHKRRIQRTRCFGRYRRYRDWRTNREVRELFRYELFDVPFVPSRRSLLRRKRGVPKHPRA